uniref:CSON014455 protein n=1 Tax=Culicoides sonorensis TaxID=179676 RepID=A0A336MEW4_CULSO
MDWSKTRMTSLDCDDEDKSISSESSGGGMQEITPNIQQHHFREDLEIWNADEIGMTLKMIPFADKAQELLDLNLIDENTDPAILNIALLLACWNSEIQNVQRLLQTYNVDVNFQDLKGRTPLHLCCINGDHFITKLLLRHNAIAHIWDSTEKVTPLHCAASAGSAECCIHLLKNGAQINSGIEKKSALAYAVQKNAVNCVKTLLQYGANPNTPQVYTETPLHVAATYGHAESMKLLLDYGAVVGSQFGRRRLTALHLAAEEDFHECVKLLLDAGANINSLNVDDQTPLHLACLSQAVKTVEVLIERGANVHSIYKDGRTALHAAIVKESRFWDCARLLLEANVDPNRVDNFGYSPLHIAALNEFSSCVLLLLDFGADITARTNGGISALSFIVRRTPEVIPKYVAKFDSAVKVNDHEIGDVDCEIKLDFRVLVPNFERGETELLLAFIEVGQKHVLKHPLSETFLFLKWRRIRKFFLFSLFYHFVFVLMFTIYILGVYVRDCDRDDDITDAASDCRAPTYIVPVGYVVILLNMILLLKEIFQNPHKLISKYDISLVPMWQHHVAAIVIWLVWLELMLIVGRFPIFGLYIQMFQTVAINFSKFLLAYCCLLIAFALSFGVLFPNYPSFEYVPWALLKTVIMMSGELEFEDIFYGDDEQKKDEDDDPQVKYPVTSHIVFFTFVLLITIILTNLMVGLAVSDIQGLQDSAGLDRLSRQAELVSRLESFLFSKLLKKAPSKILRWCQQKSLLRSSRYHLQFNIKPNDPREKRIPRDIINSIYKLVAERRDRNQSIRRRKRRNNMSLFNEYEDSLIKNTYSEIELRQTPTIRAFRHHTMSDTPTGTLQKPLLYDSSSTQYLKVSSDISDPSTPSLRKQIKVIIDTQDSILIKLNSIAKDISTIKNQKM